MRRLSESAASTGRGCPLTAPSASIWPTPFRSRRLRNTDPSVREHNLEGDDNEAERHVDRHRDDGCRSTEPLEAGIAQAQRGKRGHADGFVWSLVSLRR
jgi:hypothetical protein